MTLRNEPLAFHLCGTESKPVAPCKSVGASLRLAPTLVLPPGRYSVHGRSYLLAKEGLYRFLNPAQENQQRIIYRKDPVALLSAISWLTSHGSRDDTKSLTACERIARRGKVIVTCGNVSQLGVHLLKEQGLHARVVQAKTRDRLNTYDNGHVLMEAWLDGRWTLVDLDVKVMFRRGGRRLSLMEFSEASQTGDYTMEPISSATGIAVGCFTEEGYDYGLLMETTFCNEERLRVWYKRIMMAPILRQDGDWFITGPRANARTIPRLYPKRNFRYLPPAEFLRRFYRSPDDAAP